MQEMGVLCIMLGLFFLSLSMKRTVTETTTELPKNKSLRVLDKRKESEAEKALQIDQKIPPEPAQQASEAGKNVPAGVDEGEPEV